MNKEMAAVFLIRAWEAVTAEVLDDAWVVYEFEDDKIKSLQMVN
jgi:hypothetical protein